MVHALSGFVDTVLKWYLRLTSPDPPVLVYGAELSACVFGCWVPLEFVLRYFVSVSHYVEDKYEDDGVSKRR